MKLVDQFRDPAAARRLAGAIGQEVRRLGRERVRLMEVCGTHTMAIFRFGLRQLLPPEVELVSGPGCPVCVTAAGEVDRAVELSLRPGVRVACFGDMIRVPGSGPSLAQARARGGKAQVVYSSFDALDLARNHPDETVVFLGIGFETTAPTVAAALLKARDEGLANFCVLSSHKLLPPALEALLSGGRSRIDGFLMPGHVSTIIGAKSYEPVAQRHQVPCVVTGFEPNDILAAVLMLLRELAGGSHRVMVQYHRGACWEGNPQARAVMEKVFQPVDSLWRGLGRIPGSGLRLRPEFADFDARVRFDLPELDQLEVKDPPGCRCGEVLQGILRPPQCGLFRTTCTPQSPLGPCMVSSEGTCAAYFKYHSCEG